MVLEFLIEDFVVIVLTCWYFWPADTLSCTRIWIRKSSGLQCMYLYMLLYSLY